MKSIYKYQLPLGDTVTIEMPREAQALAVQVQSGSPYIWALVDPDAPKELRQFKVFGTGHMIPQEDPLHYLGTFQLDDGNFVFHVFESW